MKLSVAGLLVAGTIAVAPTSAVAQATLSVDPVKECYSNGESLDLFGSGFTPFGSVEVLEEDKSLGDLPSDAAGAIYSPLTLGGVRSGREMVTFFATDRTNPALTTETSLLIVAPEVTVRPTNGAAGRLLRITATGFATGPTLYAHVRRAATRRVRNMRIGGLVGACGRLSARRRIVPASAASGRYLVQFDTYRRFSRDRDVWVRFTVSVEEPRPKPKPKPPPPTNCQGYSPCIPPGPDVDCAGGEGDGPRYRDGPIYVTGSDPYDLDRDGDGVACET